MSIKVIVLNDINVNGMLELVLFGRNLMVFMNKVEIRDLLNGMLVKNIWLWKDFILEDMIVIFDINGNFSVEIGIFLCSFYDVDIYKYFVFVWDVVIGDNID